MRIWTKIFNQQALDHNEHLTIYNVKWERNAIIAIDLIIIFNSISEIAGFSTIGQHCTRLRLSV